MFMVAKAKAFFSNLAFARARAQTIEFAFLTCARTGPFGLGLRILECLARAIKIIIKSNLVIKMNVNLDSIE